MNEAQTEALKDFSSRISNSDRVAFDQLFRILYASLVGYSMKFTKEKESACDIVQDCFVKLWSVRQTLEKEGSIQAYMYRMVRNTTLNYLRDNSREQYGLEMDELAKITADSEEDLSENQQSVRMNLLKKWISVLPERQREAFELSRFEGLDHEEIASVMEVSPRTVNNHIVEALKNIQRSHDLHFHREE